MSRDAARVEEPDAGTDMVPCVIVVGPTASGKTQLGVELARCFGGEIISADSRQVYRGLDLGTGKDLGEYGQGEGAIPYHLIDVADPDEEFHLFAYLAAARQALVGIHSRGALPLVVGGSVLYVKALLDGYALDGGGVDETLRETLAQHSDEQLLDMLRTEAPDVLERTDTTQRHRLLRALEIARSRSGVGSNRGVQALPQALILAPYYPRTVIHQRIAARLDARLVDGMLEEVRRLHDQGITWERLEWFGLEYRYISRYLRGHMSLGDMRDTLLARIRRFCRSQDIWFRKIEREGKAIHWIPEGCVETAVALVQRFLDGQPLPDPILRLMEIRYGPRGD